MTAPALHTDKLPTSHLPRKARPDRFMCAWGVFDIALYPWMPTRWLAYQKAGLAYPGIDALFRALADMLRIEQSRDVIPTGELTLTIAPTPILLPKKVIPEKRVEFTFSGLLQIAGERPWFYILAPADWLTDFHDLKGSPLYWTIQMYAREVTRVDDEKIKVELFHTGAQAERRLEIIAACRKWEAQREKVAA